MEYDCMSPLRSLDYRSLCTGPPVSGGCNSSMPYPMECHIHLSLCHFSCHFSCLFSLPLIAILFLASLLNHLFLNCFIFVSMSDADLSVLLFDSYSSSYRTIYALGVGSFGYTVLTKLNKNIDDLLFPYSFKDGTLLEAHPHNKTPSDGLVAVKIMRKQLNRPSDYLRTHEVNFILSVPAHPNLLQIFDLFVDTDTGKLHIVMEPMNQSLYQFIQTHEGKRPGADAVRSMLAQLLSALRHIHHHGYFHRDVKPENILVTATKQYYGGRVPPERANDVYMLKLCDYGLSRHVSNTKSLTQYVSTRWYRAPEILLRHSAYTFPIDMWAFATVAAELVNAQPMFPGNNEVDQIWQIVAKLGHPLYRNRTSTHLGGTWPAAVHLAERMGFFIPFVCGVTSYDIFHTHSDAMVRLATTISGCFHWDPAQRPTADELCRTPYFRNSVTQVHLPTPPLPRAEFNEESLRQLYLDNMPSLPTLASSKPSKLYSDSISLYRQFSLSSNDADVSGELDEKIHVSDEAPSSDDHDACPKNPAHSKVQC